MYSKKEYKTHQSNITEDNKKIQDELINDIQNLIWALKFETGPQPQGQINNIALIIVALFELATQDPLPWQKIHVAAGPTNLAMYHVLKAAISAIKELNSGILYREKALYAEEYDLVKPLLGGEQSISNGGYVNVAYALGTITNQPGYLVSNLLGRVNDLLHKLEKFDTEKKYMNFMFFAGNNGMPKDIKNIITQNIIELEPQLKLLYKK